MKIDWILNAYGLNNNDKKEFMKIIKPIYLHDEFQRRMTKEFLHHGDVTLGEHIVEDAVVTYLMTKKYLLKHNNSKLDLNVALLIAMMHDLYTVPWQNNSNAKTQKFFNEHGFRHPIEAVINAINWYPMLFEDLECAEKIIDGIVHHMFPFPVVVFREYDNNVLELKNYDLLDKIPDQLKVILINSTKRGKIGRISICRSRYMEGKIMARADKYVSFRQIRNVSSALALVTGRNKKILKK